MASTPFSAQGAIDLGSLASARQAEAKAQQAKASAPAGVIIDVTTASFEQDVLQQSMNVPVVVDLWATWCQPCRQLSPVLEALAAEYGGRFVLAKVDVDAEQQIGAAFQVQSIPSVFAVIGGQVVPLFQGALPESQVRQYIEQLLAAAAQAGVSGTVAGAEAAEPMVEEEPEADPRFDAAVSAIDAGDWAAATAAYEQILASDPADADAKTGLALVDIYRRCDGVDSAAALTAQSADPANVDAALVAADVHALSGQWSDAFGVLIEAIKRNAGDDRDRLRTHLVTLFDIAGDDPAVAPARIALSNALF